MIMSPVVELRLKAVTFQLRPDAHHFIARDIDILSLIVSVLVGGCHGFARIGGEGAAQPRCCDTGTIGESDLTAEVQARLGGSGWGWRRYCCYPEDPHFAPIAPRGANHINEPAPRSQCVFREVCRCRVAVPVTGEVPIDVGTTKAAPPRAYDSNCTMTRTGARRPREEPFVRRDRLRQHGSIAGLDELGRTRQACRGKAGRRHRRGCRCWSEGGHLGSYRGDRWGMGRYHGLDRWSCVGGDARGCHPKQASCECESHLSHTQRLWEQTLANGLELSGPAKTLHILAPSWPGPSKILVYFQGSSEWLGILCDSSRARLVPSRM